MTHDLPTGDFEPGLAEAFDWRAARTWAAYLGSAAIIGIFSSAVPLALAILIQARSSGPVLDDELVPY